MGTSMSRKLRQLGTDGRGHQCRGLRLCFASQGSRGVESGFGIGETNVRALAEYSEAAEGSSGPRTAEGSE